MKKIISILLAVMIVATVFTAFPFTVNAASIVDSGTTGDCTWTLDDDGTLTISGNGDMADYSLAMSSENYSTNTPWEANVKSIVIENGVTSIGSWAFAGCNVSDVEIPDSVKSIGDGAFYDCHRMKSVSIPDSVTDIGHLSLGYFYGTRGSMRIQRFKIYGYPGSAENYADSNSFKFILIKGSGVTGDCLWMLDENGKLTIIGEGAMGKYSKRMSAEGTPGSESYYTTAPWGAGVKNVVIENGVTNIGEYSFCDCDELTSVDVPNSVNSIDEYAFYSCTALKDIHIPSSVTKIGGYAFWDCTGLTGVYIDDLAVWCKLEFFADGFNPLYYAHNLFINDELVTDLTIPGNITSIGNYTFSGCTGLTSVDIPNSVTSIGAAAFSRCTGLTSIDIPDSVTSIGESAFSHCTGLTSIDIPSSVTSIGSYAFFNCTGLTGVYINDLAAWCKLGFSNEEHNPLYYAHNLYIDNELVTDLIIPDSITSIAKNAFCGCTTLTSVFIPNSVTSIGDNAFTKCTKLTLIIDGKNTYALDYAKRNNIPYIYFKSGITGDCTWTYYGGDLRISGNGAMSDTPVVAPWGTDIKNAAIENGVANIRSNAFFGCEQLICATIPESVTSIGKRAFFGCKSLNSLLIPASVTSIGDQAFSGCADGFTVYGFSGSTAEIYANENNIPFVEIEKPIKIGDSNGDGNIDVLDAAAIQKFAAGKAEMTNVQRYNADVNGDNKSDVLDAAMIKKYSAGKITEFPKKV